MYDLKGKENQNKKISDFEYLNYFEYESHCLISTDLLCYLPDFKAEKKSIIFERGGLLDFIPWFYEYMLLT